MAPVPVGALSMATATVAEGPFPQVFAGVAVTEPETSLNWTVICDVPAPVMIWAPRGRVQLYSVAPEISVML